MIDDQRQSAAIGTNQLLTEILGVLRHMDSTERSGAVSSCKITLQRGSVDIAVHAYTGSDIEAAEGEAISSYRRILSALNENGTEAFRKTLDAITRARAGE